MSKDENETIYDEMIKEYDEFGNSITISTYKLYEIISNEVKISEIKSEGIVLDYETIGKKFDIPKVICDKIKIKKEIIFKRIYYDRQLLFNIPQIIQFIDTKLKSKIYRAFTKEFIIKKLEELNFINPIIIKRNIEMPYSELDGVLDNVEDIKLIIQDKEIIDYEDYFKKEIKNDTILKGKDLTDNFEFYFKYPDPNEEFQLIESGKRCLFYDFKNKMNKKIFGICGPMGIGKSTTLLFLVKFKDCYCYFNIKALYDKGYNFIFWKEKLLLKEIAYALSKKYEYDKFKKLKSRLEKVTNFWNGIIEAIKFFIMDKIKMNLIFDQYKEKYDKNYKNIKEISELLEKDSDNYVSIIISSSINDKDVRDSLINEWINENENRLFLYSYFINLINIKNNISEDKSLTENQKKMIIEDFNSIPKFYYAIKSQKNDTDLILYKNLQIEKIKGSLNEFFSEPSNYLVSDKIILLINERRNFGKTLESETFKNLIKILPFKYFLTLNDEKIINFAFPLVKQVFDEFLSIKICEFLKNPVSSFKEGTIGDILELNLVNDLKKNLFCTFELIFTVQTIWNLTLKEQFNSSYKNKNILILQDETNAQYIDFAILNNGENLLLYQCKKALKYLPKNPITRKIIKEKIFLIKNDFYKYFGVSLKKIYLFYFTGITFFNEKEEIKSRTWGAKEDENYDNIKILANNAEAELLYYEVINGKIYFENNEINSKFENIADLILHAINFSNPILVTSEEANEDLNIKINLFNEEKYSDTRNSLDKIIYKNIPEFFTSEQKIFLNKYYPDIYKNKIFGYINNPKQKDFNYQRMIGIKRSSKNYLIMEKKQKMREIKEKKKKILKNKKKDVEEKEDEKEEKGEKNDNINIREEKEDKMQTCNECIKALFEITNDSLKEINRIGTQFFQNISQAFYFENNYTYNPDNNN